MYLSIVVPCFNDYDGLFFTLTHLKETFVTSEVEIVVIDTSTNPDCHEPIKDLCVRLGCDYHFKNSPQGSAVAKNYAIEMASGEYVMCLDSHVLLYIEGGLSYLKRHLVPDTIYHGLLVAPGGRVQADSLKENTKYASMLGIWTVSDTYKNTSKDNYDIPMAGMGFFIVHKATWRKFNPEFRGFGFEEYYIHQKYLLSGGHVKCLRKVRWIHRFRKGVLHKQLSTAKRNEIMRNYEIGLLELGLHEKYEQIVRKVPSSKLPRGLTNPSAFSKRRRTNRGPGRF